MFGLAVASIDLASGHKIYGLNNMIACLIATDILQASPQSVGDFFISFSEKQALQESSHTSSSHAHSFNFSCGAGQNLLGL